MGDLQSKLKRKSNKFQVIKRKLKLLLVDPDLKIVKAVIKKAPNAVIGAISKEALNCREGAVHISLQLIFFFRHHNNHFNYLFSRTKAILYKQKLIFHKSD